MFNLINLLELKTICIKITNLCDEQVEGDLMLSQKMFLGQLITDFINTPVVKTSGIKSLNGYSALQSENERLREALKSVRQLNLHLYEDGTIGNRVHLEVEAALNPSTVKEVGSNG